MPEEQKDVFFEKVVGNVTFMTDRTAAVLNKIEQMNAESVRKVLAVPDNVPVQKRNGRSHEIDQILPFIGQAHDDVNVHIYVGNVYHSLGDKGDRYMEVLERRVDALQKYPTQELPPFTDEMNKAISSLKVSRSGNVRALGA